MERTKSTDLTRRLLTSIIHTTERYQEIQKCSTHGRGVLAHGRHLPSL
nr:MAG TPA: hypothetical protein [Caudoviricetes sp.]